MKSMIRPERMSFLLGIFPATARPIRRRLFKDVQTVRNAPAEAPAFNSLQHRISNAGADDDAELRISFVAQCLDGIQPRGLEDAIDPGSRSWDDFRPELQDCIPQSEFAYHSSHS
jgi:hypothetical protein